MNYMRIIFKKFKARMIVGCILAVIALLAVSVIVFINQASFGRTPRGERLERVMKSPNYRNGEFKNQHETLLMTSDRGRFSGIWEFIFRKIDGLRPKQAVKAIKTDLRKIDRNEEILVWFGPSGHSAFSSQKGAMLNKHSRGCNDITNMKNEICNIEANDFRKLMHEE